MGIGYPIGWPLFGGSVSSTTLVPSLYPVALDGRPYLLDLQQSELSPGFTHETIPLLRQQADQSSSPAEASLNPEDLWRRAQDSWHIGAGQVYRDKPDGEFNRFRSSKGIDIWTRYQFSLLPDTDQKLSSANTNLTLMPVGSYLYLTDGGGANTGLKYTQDITVDTPSWTTVTGTPATAPAVNQIASDGYNVWTAHGSSGIYATTRGAATTASQVTGTVGGPIAYVKGRLMVANANSIYNITTFSGALPTALFTAPNTDFTWVGFAEGQAAIYAAGFSGDKSRIFRITVKQDASALDQPIQAGELPDGEIIRSINGYLGYIMLGTDLGWRFCIADQQGNLQIGPLVRTNAAVKCFEGQDAFCWFGYTNYDSTSTGLGRFTPETFSEASAAPSWASDLMVTAQGEVLSVATFQNIRVFTVSASGVYAQHTNKVASGTIDGGLVGYGLPDSKTVVFFDVRTRPLAGSWTAYLSVDESSTFQQTHTQTTASTTGSEAQIEYTGEFFEPRLVLTRSGTDTTTGPTVKRWTLKANPTLSGGLGTSRSIITAPLLLHDVERGKGQAFATSIIEELEHISVLRDSGRVTTWQQGAETYPVIVTDFRWAMYDETSITGPENQKTFNGTLLVKLKRLS